MSEIDDKKNSLDRRRFLTLGAAVAAGGLAGLGSGYSLRQLPWIKSRTEPPGSRRFKARKKAILERHNQQTREAIARLKTSIKVRFLGKSESGI